MSTVRLQLLLRHKFSNTSCSAVNHFTQKAVVFFGDFDGLTNLIEVRIGNGCWNWQNFGARCQIVLTLLKRKLLARIIHDGMSSVLILREIEKRLSLPTVLSRHIQAEPVAM